MIRQDKVVTRCDVSAKDRIMGRCWKLITRNQQILMQWDIYSKKWYGNILGLVEATILLDLITVITKKAKQIDQGIILVVTDNKAI